MERGVRERAHYVYLAKGQNSGQTRVLQMKRWEIEMKRKMAIRASECCLIRESESESVPDHFGETGSKSDHRSALDVVVVPLEVLDGAAELELLQSRSSKEPGDQRNKSDSHYLSLIDFIYWSNSPLCMRN